MSDVWGEFDRILKEHRERLIKDQKDMDREINFALFGLGFCIGLIVGIFDMKFEYISTARTQAVSDLNILMYSPDGVKNFKVAIETGANANQVANSLESLAREIREKAQPLPFRVY